MNVEQLTAIDMKAEQFLDVVLQDALYPDDNGDRDWGGTASVGETLGEFIESANISPETDMQFVNEELKACNIRPLSFVEPKRFLDAVYDALAGNGNCDIDMMRCLPYEADYDKMEITIGSFKIKVESWEA